jgi:hypothetical protein
MLRDAEHFKSKIGALDGADDTADFIVKLVQEKHVREAPNPTPIPEKDTFLNGTSPSPSTKLEDPEQIKPVDV